MSYEQAMARLDAEAAWYRPLTHKQRRFVCAMYANGFDQTKAALEADPSLRDEREARRVGNRWLALKTIRAAMAAVDTYYTASTKVRFEDLINELRILAFSSIADHVHPDGTPKPITDDETARALVAVTVTPNKYGDQTTVKMHDKIGPITQLLKIYAPKSMQGADEGSESDKATHVNVSTINVIPVPSGQYLPAPPEPEYTRSPLIVDAVPLAPPSIPAIPAHYNTPATT